MRTFKIAVVAALAVISLGATSAAAKLSPAGELAEPCRGTWWIERGSLEYGAKLPEFGFSKCDGAELSTADLEGTPLLLNFWATWCGPCRKELPQLNQLAADAGGALRVVGVSLDRDRATLRDFIDEAELSYDVTWDGGGIARDLGIMAIPLTLAVDAEGRVVGAHQGYATKEQFEALAQLAGAELPEDAEPK